jgi:hypothetical protein
LRGALVAAAGAAADGRRSSDAVAPVAVLAAEAGSRVDGDEETKEDTGMSVSSRRMQSHSPMTTETAQAATVSSQYDQVSGREPSRNQTRTRWKPWRVDVKSRHKRARWTTRASKSGLRKETVIDKRDMS